MPLHIMEVLGNYVVIKGYVDANYVGNFTNGRSHYGIIIYIKNAPIIWYNNHQNAVESLSFGSDVFALRIATEMIEALR